MAAAMQQAAPEKEEKRRANTPKSKTNTPDSKGKLHDLPLAVGIAAMAVLLALSLFVGNFRALQNAAPKDFLRQGDVSSIIEDRAAQAGNVIAVATRAGLDAELIADASSSMQAFEQAKSAREISRADQKLTTAVAQLTTANIADAETRGNMQRAADNFAEQGSFLRQEARSFNSEAKKAQALYESLPTRALLPEPDVYEGI